MDSSNAITQVRTSFSPRLVELVGNPPRRFLPRLNAKIDVRFGADRDSRRPKHDFRHRPIALLPNAGAGLAILDAKVEVRGGRAESLDLGLQRLAALELLQVEKISAADLREVF